MKRVAGFLLGTTLALAQPAAVPQPDRAAYQAAYGAWRTADSDLERDTAAANPAMGARADKAGADAAKYFAAWKTYLEQSAADLDQRAAATEPFPAPLPLDPRPAAYIATQNRALIRSIESITNDPDRAIQRLRVALDRERNALADLTSLLADSQHGYEQIEAASTAAEQARGKVTQGYQALSASVKQTTADTEQTAGLWTSYYRALSEGLRGVLSKNVPPGEIVAAPVAANPSAAFNKPPDTAGNPPAPKPRVTPLPLSRYLGAWIYPALGAQFTGPEPATVDMLIREINGQAKGSLTVWFKMATNSKTEPAVRFDFEGPFQSTRNQSFPLVTGNGAKGTVELIPGSVYNMIQVRFTTEDKPETVRQADFLAIKK